MSAKKTAFVIMPFDAELDEVYSDLLAPLLVEVGFEVRRADDIYNQRNILRDIVQSIADCDLVVADLTGLNPNVFYELGVAHGLGKKVVLLTQSVEEVPFDLRSYRIIHYQTHFTRVEQARIQLRETARGAFDETIVFGSPITDFLGSSVSGSKQFELRESESSPALPGTEPIDEEKGWLDHMSALEVGFPHIVQILDKVTSATVEVGQVTREFTEKIVLAQKSTEPNPGVRVQFIMGEYARTLSAYGQKLAALNNEYERENAETRNSIEFILAHGNFSDADSMKKTEEFLETLSKIEEAAHGARESFGGMRESMRAIEGLEKHLTRAAKVAGSEVDRFLANIESTVAAVRRGIEVGSERLVQERAGHSAD